MFGSILCGYIGAYILVSATITVPNTGRTANPNNRKNIMINICVNCISEINSAPIDNAKGIDVVMPMYNLIKYSDNDSKTSGYLWQYYRDEPFIINNGAIADFSAENKNITSLKFITKIAGRIGNNSTKNV